MAKIKYKLSENSNFVDVANMYNPRLTGVVANPIKNWSELMLYKKAFTECK
jgi:hypothetical protein